MMREALLVREGAHRAIKTAVGSCEPRRVLPIEGPPWLHAFF